MVTPLPKHVDFELPGWAEFEQGDVAAVVVPQPLVAWECNEGSGSVFTDSGSFGYDLDNGPGAITWGSGTATFGSGEYRYGEPDVANGVPQVISNDGEFSCFVRCNIDAAGIGSNIEFTGNRANSHGFRFRANSNNKLHLSNYQNAIVISAADVLYSQMVTYGITVNAAGDVTFWHEGVAVDTQLAAGTGLRDAGFDTIGTDGMPLGINASDIARSSTYFTTNSSPVTYAWMRLWPQALTAAQVLEIPE